MTRPVQIIPPRSDLKKKAVNSSRGFDLRLTPEVVHKLEEVVHRSRDKFTTDIARQLTAMRGALADTGERPAERRALVSLLYEASLEIKGAGGTIGYDLLTVIGKSLNDFVTGLQGLDERQREVVGLHIDALYAVLAKRITGRGGMIEAALVEAFGEARRKLRPGESDDERDA